MNDACQSGFTPRSPAATPGIDRLIDHVMGATRYSPYLSLTRSYGVALDYAKMSATASNPGWIYEIELNAPLPYGL